ncbi:class I SAM-dependent methyltransferase [Elioraea sp.]|uniref:class I SAM-dependent methyltransferase n=1 Tax=Elioraea sp. TaxID=2185103 RepID=UPI00307FBFB0
MALSDPLTRYISCVLACGQYSTAFNLRQYVSFMFKGVDLEGKRVLDVGGGTGLLTLYAAVRGAEAICLEPEADGATSGAALHFARMESCIDTGGRARFVPAAFQDFLDEQPFDIIVMANSINHLDEEACVRLAHDDAAQASYHAIFRKAWHLLREGGILIITDCNRSNVFNDLGLRSPFCPTIEWHKHQHPRLWDRLLQRAGFMPARYEWTSPNRLGGLGRLLLGNRVAAYFLLSHFRLVARKPGSGTP